MRTLAPPMLLIALVVSAACAHPGRPATVAVAVPVRVAPGPCDGCSTLPMSADIAGAIEARITDLKTRGGDCVAYGQVLEHSLAGGQIAVKPYMWRVGVNLASAEARPNGEMALAREIDSLNVGVRTLVDVVWSVEHEAAHIAFRIPSGQALYEQSVDRHVRECHAGNAHGTEQARY